MSEATVIVSDMIEIMLKTESFVSEIEYIVQKTERHMHKQHAYMFEFGQSVPVLATYPSMYNLT